MKDKINIAFIEATVEVTCAVCSKRTYGWVGFGDSTSLEFDCDECGRTFELLYSVQPLNAKKILQRRKKENQFPIPEPEIDNSIEEEYNQLEDDEDSY